MTNHAGTFDELKERLAAENKPVLSDDALASSAAAHERLLLAEYWHAGLEPLRSGNGALVSLTLAKMLGLNVRKVGQHGE